MEVKGDLITTTCATSLSTVPEDEVFVYIAVKGSLHANDCAAFGLNEDEIKALVRKFSGSGTPVINGVLIKTNVMTAINALSHLGYKVASSTGEAEITWTLQREL